MKKKFLSIFLATILLITGIPLLSSATDFQFSDVPANAWYTNAVMTAYEKAYFKGTSATEFSPEAPMTRAMFVTVLANMTSDYGANKYGGKSIFEDVEAGKWYTAPINWAAEKEIAAGFDEGVFRPHDSVTREQMAMFMYNYAAATGNETSFTKNASQKFADVESISDWAENAMDWAVTHGILAGNEKNRLEPTKDAARCEVAQVAVNAEQVLQHRTIGGSVTTSSEKPEGSTPSPAPTPSTSPTATPTPSATPTPVPSATPTPPVNTDPLYPEEINIDSSIIPSGAMTYDEFVTLYDIENAEYKVSDEARYSITARIKLKRNLTIEQVNRIEPLGEELEKLYYRKLSNKFIESISQVYENDNKKHAVENVYCYFLSPKEVYAMAQVSFRVDNSVNAGAWVDYYNRYDGEPDHFEFLGGEDSWQYWEPAYFAAIRASESINEVVEAGGMKYDDFTNLFSNLEQQEGSNTYYIYPNQALTAEQKIAIGKTEPVFYLYVVGQIEELIEKNLFGASRDKLASPTIYYFESPNQIRPEFFRVDYVLHPEMSSDYMPPGMGGRTTIWYSSTLAHLFEALGPDAPQRYTPTHVEVPNNSEEGGLTYGEFKELVGDIEVYEGDTTVSVSWERATILIEDYNIWRQKYIATDHEVIDAYCMNLCVDYMSQNPKYQPYVEYISFSINYAFGSQYINYDYTKTTEEQL